MAQGQALSTFVRLAETQPEEARWEDAAERTWRSFRQERSTTEPWSTFIQDGDLWFEEYAGDQPPLMVLNGQIFGLYGIYDYFMHTGDPEAELYFDGGATTVLTILPDIRVPGELSYYCVQPDFCQIPRWQAPGYHAIHIKQLEMLAQMTGDNVFTKWSDLLLADSAPEV
jgi:hypothetical protein